ncbi:MAG: c-type cytochrome [bacterium]
MAKRSDTPIEERDYSQIYFICSAILALTTFWAVFEMIWVRSPWQRTQRDFNALEKQELMAEREQKTAALDQTAYQQLQADLAAAQKELNSADYKQALQDSAKAALEIAKAVQNYRFTKSEADAEYYLFKEAQYHHDKSGHEEHGKKYEELNARALELKEKWDEADSHRVEVINRLAGFRQKATDLQTQIAGMMKEVDELDFRLARIDERTIKIQQVVMPEFVKGNFGAFLSNVDRCHTCHISVTRKGFEHLDSPYRTHSALDTLIRLHPIERFGCTPCHDGQGPALEDVDHAHGEVKHWEHPMLRGAFVYAGCNKCHAKELRLDHAPSLNRAKRMLADLGCYGCHEIRGYETAERIGPDLSRIGNKLSPGWVYGWLRDNREFRPHTRMPNALFTEAEATAATAFLFSVSKNDWAPVRAAGRGNAPAGERLISIVGCKACHVVTPEDRAHRANGLPYDIGPDLGTVAKKVNEDWLFDWIKNPKHYSPETRMPSLRLSDQEAADIVAYLLQIGRDLPLPENYTKGLANLSDPALITEGRAIVRNFGCHGCHLIPGLEKEGRVSVSLNEFGAKLPEELFFGDALANGTVPHKTWEDWTLGKLKNSREYATEAVIQRMPNYQMADSDAVNFSVLLRSWDGRVIGERYLKPWGGREENIENGRLLARQLNCTGCHVIEGEGGDIRPSLTDALMKEGMDEIAASAYAPPNLLGEGKKVQSEWLFHFLKEPKTGEIRPWLRTRMPTFALTDAEANTIINYFKAEADETPGFTFLPEFHLSPEQRASALTLASPNYFACFSCHQQGAKKPEGPPDGWAPDLTMAKQRLDPNWIAEWIRDPQKLLPGTRMPSFYPDSYPSDVLEGDPDKQIVALRNYLLSLGN